MFRNREVKRLITLILFIGVAQTTGLFFINIVAGIISAVAVVSIIALVWHYTKKRMSEIDKTSTYLAAICSGVDALDIRDNREGELSILKSNIYKTSIKLRSQAEMMQNDKKYLADALADISHQLKTPITSMIMMSDLLKDENISKEKQKEFLVCIDKQLEKTQWIITNILKLSKIDSGQIEFKCEQVELKDVVEEALTPFLIAMELKGQELEFNCAGRVGFVGDKDWTVEAVSNIIKNCIEHCFENGKIVINCSDNLIYSQLDISDNGCGICKEDLPHVFERFYKGKNSSSNSVGIGLALAKTVCGRENATIEVSSRHGFGTKFTLKFYKRTV